MNPSDQNAGLLDEFSDALWLEDGLSRNTLESYRSDLQKLAEWMWIQNRSDGSLKCATHTDLLEFLAYKVSKESRPVPPVVSYQV